MEALRGERLPTARGGRHVSEGLSSHGFKEFWFRIVNNYIVGPVLHIIVIYILLLTIVDSL